MVAFLICLFAGLSTAVGGLLVALKRDLDERFLAVSLGFSAGVMLYISLVELLPQGIEGLEEAGVSSANVWGPAAFFAGVLLIAVIDRFVPEDINPHEEPSAIGAARMRRVGLMTALAIAIHNFPEGFATFFVALQDPVLAAPIAVAIAIHNVPEGIAVAVPIHEATGKRWRAAGWATLSGLAEPLGAILGYLFLKPFLGPASLGLTFAMIAGIMVFVSLDKLLPTAISTDRHHAAVYGVIGGMAVMAVSLVLLA